jgi:hypothetical protein
MVEVPEAPAAMEVGVEAARVKVPVLPVEEVTVTVAVPVAVA